MMMVRSLVSTTTATLAVVGLSLCSMMMMMPMSVVGMAHLTPEMSTATTVEELMVASGAYDDKEQQAKESERARIRMLQGFNATDSEIILADSFGNVSGFYHGVASGDPLPTAVIIWTRYTPVTVDETVTLELRMAEKTDSPDVLDPRKNPDLHRVMIQVTSETDFIAKLDVTGLKPNTKYIYAFSDGKKRSRIGYTRTAPAPEDVVDEMTYAVFSCSHFSNGYFHAYDIASTIKDLDFWIHVGDYVYEYGTYYSYARDVERRRVKILPLWEQISLQDHRNRMATYHTDRGLQNLRRMAPLIATWDDHETSNNAYGNANRDETGAENHQEVCPVNFTAPDANKTAAQCDRNEGMAWIRFKKAAQAYLEWLPLRKGPGTMGSVVLGDITQVISWGDMATIVAFDTRISYRSKTPTLAGSTWSSFFPLAATVTDVKQYLNGTSPANAQLLAAAASVKALQENSTFTMIGENKEILRSEFRKSKAAKQPWQIWAAATALGKATKGDYYTMHKLITDPVKAAAVKNITDALHASPAGLFLRSLYAEAITLTPWNRDDFSGFVHEQKQILQILKEETNNPIVLGGDLHDSYAWQLYEGGATSGTPAAVNLVCPGVTSPGWGPFIRGTFAPLVGPLGSMDAVLDLLELAEETTNPGLKYFNHQYKGFFAVKATKQTHVAEFFAIAPATILSSYKQAYLNNTGKITAKFFCDAQVTTTAGQRGSLVRSNTCSAIEFETERPDFWKLKFRKSSTVGLSTVKQCGYESCEFAV